MTVHIFILKQNNLIFLEWNMHVYVFHLMSIKLQSTLPTLNPLGLKKDFDQEKNTK